MSAPSESRAARPGSTFIRARRIGQGTWWEGRSGLIVPVIVAGFATYLLVGVLTMDVAEDADRPGPQFFPTLVMIACYVLAILLAIAYVRHPDPVQEPSEAAEPDPADFHSPLSSAVAAASTEPGHADDTARERTLSHEAARSDAKHRTHSDFVSMGWGVGGFAAFAALIVPAGWILSATALFWCVARAMGSRRPVFDLTLALTFASVVYLAFDTVLGLNLPSGILGGGA